MKRLNIAMLGDQEPMVTNLDENNESLSSDQDALEIKVIDMSINEIETVVDETKDTAGSIVLLAEKIDQMQTVSDEAMQVAQEAVAYFVKRTGVKMTGVGQAFESYSSTDQNKKKELVKQLTAASEGLNKQIFIAQEGMLDRIKLKLSLMFTSSKKLRKELEQVSAEFDKRGPKKEVIVDPAFARILNAQGKDKILPADVLKLTSDIFKISNENLTIKTMRELTDMLGKINLSLNRSTFIAKAEEVEKLRDFENKMQDIHTGIVDKLEFDIDKEKADAQPLSVSDKNKLKESVIDLLEISDFEKADKQLAEAIIKYEEIYDSNLLTRFAGDYADDMKAAKSIMELTIAIYGHIHKIMGLRYEIAHACVKYIKASSGK